MLDPSASRNPTGRRTRSQLPGCEHAWIPEGTLKNYALSPEHKEGKHKARVFRGALGYEQEHSHHLHEQILERLPEYEAVLVNPDTGWGE